MYNKVLNQRQVEKIMRVAAAASAQARHDLLSAALGDAEGYEMSRAVWTQAWTRLVMDQMTRMFLGVEDQPVITNAMPVADIVTGILRDEEAGAPTDSLEIFDGQWAASVRSRDEGEEYNPDTCKDCPARFICILYEDAVGDVFQFLDEDED